MTVGGRGIATATITSSPGGNQRATFETYESGAAHAAIAPIVPIVDSEDDFDMPSTSGARKKKRTQTQTRFCCRQCCEVLFTEEDYDAHVERHMAMCEKCGKTFTRKSSLKRHEKQVHGAKP